MTRKELINDYKHLKPRIGVFQIRNTANGKVFIEGSTNLDKIWNRHRTELRFGSHRNKPLQQDWAAFGEASFVFEILSEIAQPEDGTPFDANREMKGLEKLFMEEVQPFGERGYHA
ncbi:MAG: GIY-YIG nuclease family protein [Saprospiraceae bacterium]|nr:GIY-YIG nuclease family protein [Saprospiraceae bacterium]MCF8248654.1 GIY-YIG nuclease family protein [Saprospiraceae bacterium]MCF8278856.1 GIY-YIG nuclease family protein [Bacteroidales bacterium]MCF8310656.1 GIY-YIG nuclease family protein [Saprospiraceae bacterium]MCF8439215.1 GIY-YIG nuclease family protein [Saprospiraceae bacterium]